MASRARRQMNKQTHCYPRCWLFWWAASTHPANVRIFESPGPIERADAARDATHEPKSLQSALLGAQAEESKKHGKVAARLLCSYLLHSTHCSICAFLMAAGLKCQRQSLPRSCYSDGMLSGISAILSAIGLSCISWWHAHHAPTSYQTQLDSQL